jgi:hypothetical protein
MIDFDLWFEENFRELIEMNRSFMSVLPNSLLIPLKNEFLGTVVLRGTRIGHRRSAKMRAVRRSKYAWRISRAFKK